MLDAVILGISQSVAIVVQAIAYIMTFVIILSFVNNTLIWFGDRVGIHNMTIEVNRFSYRYYVIFLRLRLKMFSPNLIKTALLLFAG